MTKKLGIGDRVRGVTAQWKNKLGWIKAKSVGKKGNWEVRWDLALHNSVVSTRALEKIQDSELFADDDELFADSSESSGGEDDGREKGWDESGIRTPISPNDANFDLLNDARAEGPEDKNRYSLSCPAVHHPAVPPHPDSLSFTSARSLATMTKWVATDRMTGILAT